MIVKGNGDVVGVQTILERLVAPYLIRAACLYNLVKAKRTAAYTPAGAGVGGCCDIENDLFQMLLVTQRDHIIAILIFLQVAKVVGRFLHFNIRFVRNHNICGLIGNYHLCHGQRRQFHGHLVA